MAATYYAQLLAAYRWADIRQAIDNAVAVVRDWFEENDGNLASSPTDGWDISYKGILANASYDEGEEEIVASVYLGRGYRDSPSGSFYAPWSAVPDSVRDRDARWWEAFERAAARHGLYLVSGEGDPTDTYVTRNEPIEDLTLASALMPDDIGAK